MPRPKLDSPRGVLKSPATGQEPYQHGRFHPSPDLAPYVEHYWTVEWDLSGQRPMRVETLPHPSVHMIFEPRKSRIRGPARAKFSRLLKGRGGVFAVKFTPGGFHAFAGVPVSRFADVVVRFERVFGAAGGELDRAVLAERSTDARIAIVERFLRGRQPKPDDNVWRVTDMVLAATRERGIVKVDDLVLRFGLNKRTLQRLFERYAGVSPKWVIQRYRLHEAAEQLAAANPPAQADLALQLGYSDQAHFVRDFKSIVGVSPAAYARQAQG